MRMATVGENIRKHRKAQGLSIVGLAEKVGMTEGAIRHYESGIRTPGEEQLKKIARALDVSPKMLEDHKIESAREHYSSSKTSSGSSQTCATAAYGSTRRRRTPRRRMP